MRRDPKTGQGLMLRITRGLRSAEHEGLLRKSPAPDESCIAHAEEACWSAAPTV